MTALSTLLADFDALDADWFVEPKDKLGFSESARVRAFMQMRAFVAPGLHVTAIPNAGRRSRWEIAERKKEGLRAGAADHIVLWNRGCAFLEWKNGRDMPDQAQRDFLNSVMRMGHPAAVVRTAAGAYGWLQSVGAPVDLKVLEGLR